MKIERFAPSPTGLLHLGHAYSALLAYNSAIRSGGKFFIRIEDIDQIRCKKLFIEQILDDLKWLGINHEKLTVPHNGIQRRLTDVHGHVIKDLIS